MTNRILLAHGSGGTQAHALVAEIVAALDSPALARLDDAALLEIGGRLAFTTDSYVVQPIFFPGGDIGKLAVCGTVNDLSMLGATPEYLSLALIIEEGLEIEVLRRVVASIRKTAALAGVSIVTGDTKVVGRGAADRLFINTAGVGVVPEGIDISGHHARPGDAVILSGSIGDHGIAVLSRREGLAFETKLKSDCAPLNGLVQAMLDTGATIHTLRDPTRGGLASVLKEIAVQSEVAIEVDEIQVPVRDAVAAACEMLGLDPFYVANEGKLVALVPPADADKILAAMRAHEHGREAAVIGDVLAGSAGRVTLRTNLGTSRLLNMLAGEPLPRIC